MNKSMLLLVDGNLVQIPNATVYKSNLRNFTANSNRREDFVVGIDCAGVVEAVGGRIEHFGMPVDPGNLLLFAEHTWGPFETVSHPHSVFTRAHWHLKANFAYQAVTEAHNLSREALTDLAATLDKHLGSGAKGPAEKVLRKEAMGFGDVKFMAAIGAFLGWQATIFSFFFSAVLGSFVGLGGIFLKLQEKSSRIPYGPYIAAAAAIWIFLSPAAQQATGLLKRRPCHHDGYRPVRWHAIS